MANVVVLPFNDVDAARAVIESEGDELAAVLVEPLLGSAGMIPAEPAYLEMLREITERKGILLIFDEVVSLRVAYGGAQEHFGIRPDLTCLGKMIGGGFPLGAFGGRSDIMAMFDPSSGRPVITPTRSAWWQAPPRWSCSPDPLSISSTPELRRSVPS
jgi:glutamate-1-semialdehyde 2,1-aminomutase